MVVPISPVFVPAGVVSSVRVAVMVVIGIPAAAKLCRDEPMAEAQTHERTSVVVAEVITAISGTAEEVVSQEIKIDQHARCVEIPRRAIDGPIEVNGSKQTATSRPLRIIPVAVAEHITAGGPSIAVGYPHPVG